MNSCEGSRPGSSPDWFACLLAVCLRYSAGVRKEGKRFRWEDWRLAGRVVFGAGLAEHGVGGVAFHPTHTGGSRQRSPMMFMAMCHSSSWISWGTFRPSDLSQRRTRGSSSAHSLGT